MTIPVLSHKMSLRVRFCINLKSDGQNLAEGCTLVWVKKKRSPNFKFRNCSPIMQLKVGPNFPGSVGSSESPPGYNSISLGDSYSWPINEKLKKPNTFLVGIFLKNYYINLPNLSQISAVNSFGFVLRAKVVGKGERPQWSRSCW